MADLPIEKDAKVLESYFILTGTSTNLSIESVRTYESKNTLAKDFTDYLNYFKKKYWTIAQQNKQQYLATLKATKPSQKSTYEILITGGSETAKQVIVTLKMIVQTTTAPKK